MSEISLHHYVPDIATLWQAVSTFIHFQDMNSWYQQLYFH